MEKDFSLITRSREKVDLLQFPFIACATAAASKFDRRPYIFLSRQNLYSEEKQ